MSLKIKTDLQGLALSRLSEGVVFASLEDAIVKSLKVLPKRHSNRGAEFLVFSTALLASKRLHFNYLLRRAREERIEREVLNILLSIDATLAGSPNPAVQDIRTLYELRTTYYHVRKPLLKAIRERGAIAEGRREHEMSPDQIVEYAG